MDFNIGSFYNNTAQMKNSQTVVPAFCFFMICSTFGFSQTDSVHKNTGFIDPNLYYDTREFEVFTVNALVNLPARFQYFTTINLFSNPHETDLSSYYIENHLWWNPVKKVPLDLAQYWVTLPGSGNDALKYGIRWRANDTEVLKHFFSKINAMYSINLYILDVTKLNNLRSMNQIQHVYRIQFQTKSGKKWGYLSGFANQYHSFQQNNISFSWVTEHQFGFRLFDGFHAVVEYRINTFSNTPQGLGLGIEYFMPF